MSILRYYTVGAVARDVRALVALDERLEDLGVTAVSVLMGAFHPPTGIAVQVVMTLAVIIGLILYHRRPHLEKKLLAMGLPERFAEEWEGAFHDGFALALATVPSDFFDEVQDAFLQVPGIESPLALDRRPVL